MSSSPPADSVIPTPPEGPPPLPSAPVKHSLRVIHGVSLEDPYAWLANESDADAQAYLDSEIAYTDAAIRRLQPLKDLIYEELRARIAEDDCSVAERIGDFYYYSCSRAGKEYEIHYRRAAGIEAQAVVLDENELAAGYDYFDLGEFVVCPRHRLVAYTVDTSGDEVYQLYVRDIESGQVLEGPIDNVSEDICWCEDATGVFYVAVDGNSRPNAALVHILGTASTEDRLLFHESDPAFFVSVWKSRSKEFVFIESHSNTTSEVHFIDANGTNDHVQCFRAREYGVEYSIDHRPGEFLLLTNLHAPNFRLLSAPQHDFQQASWHELVPHRPEVALEFVDVYARHTVLCERRAGLPVLRIIDADNKAERLLQFPDPVYELDVDDLDDFHSTEIWLQHSSPVKPDTIYAVPMHGGERRTLKAQELADYDPDDYSAERLWVATQDGVEVPLTLVRKKTTVGPSPVLLQGYGAYEESFELYFDSDLVSLLDRGVIVAIAHVRGGGELGRPWYAAGKLLHKENSFNDFMACAEYLIANGYTSAGRIALYGSSAGGLLVAVAMQRRPELFAAVVAEVPFVDVINTLLDEDAPLTQHDMEEFGDPNDAQVFEYFLRYSPYENVRAGVYPPLLVTAALEDQRVGYWEPLKWVAKLRAAKTDKNPLLLKIEDAGHHGHSGRYQELEHCALVYAFLLQHWGIVPAQEE